MEHFVTYDFKVHPSVVRDITSKCVYKGKTHYYVVFDDRKIEGNAWVNRDNMRDCRELLIIFNKRSREMRKIEENNMVNLSSSSYNNGYNSNIHQYEEDEYLGRRSTREVKYNDTNGRYNSSEDDFDGYSMRESNDKKKQVKHEDNQVVKISNNIVVKKTCTRVDNTDSLSSRKQDNINNMIVQARKASLKQQKGYYEVDGEKYIPAYIKDHVDMKDKYYFNVYYENVHDDDNRMILSVSYDELVQYAAVMLRRYLQSLNDSK